MTYPKILSYNINFYEKVIYYTILIFMQKKLMYNTILILIQLLSVYYKIFTKHLITTQTARICALSDFFKDMLEKYFPLEYLYFLSLYMY